MGRTLILGPGMEWHPLPGHEDEPAAVIRLSPYLNVEDNIRRIKALGDWRKAMHPDDRAWLDQVEAPLRAWGWEPPVPSFMDTYGDPDLIDTVYR